MDKAQLARAVGDALDSGGFDGLDGCIASATGEVARAQRDIDTAALCDAVGKAAGQAVFQDRFGPGVALVGNVSYASSQELAESIGKNSWDI